MSARRVTSKTQFLRRQHCIRASYYGGGTSRVVFFRKEDLLQDQSEWESIFKGVLGSPDSNKRQLDGMGGGISSPSKICVIGLSNRPDVDVDYTFVQVGVETGEEGFFWECIRLRQD